MVDIIIWIAAFIIAITVHEASHAYAADKLGDPTARLSGRLSLNPLVHYDPIGTSLLLFLLVLRFLGIPVIPFGWAKPVVFDPYNLKNPRRDAAIISFAGPFSNFALATFFALLLRITLIPFSPISFLTTVFEPLIFLNVILGIFNLIPVHPLDGGKILVGILPRRDAYQVDRFMQQYGIIIIFLLVFPVFGGVSPIFALLGPVINVILKLLIPGAPVI